MDGSGFCFFPTLWYHHVPLAKSDVIEVVKIVRDCDTSTTLSDKTLCLFAITSLFPLFK